MAILAGGAARRESVTIDEVAHIGAGVSYLQKLDMRMNEEHPPLSKVLMALPLVLRGIHADYTDASWTFSGEKFFNQYLAEWSWGHSVVLRWNPAYSTVWWARLPMLLLTLLLGVVIYYCGSKLGDSSWGGLLCLTAFVTTPAFLAFGPLAITDIAITLFWVLAAWQLPRMWRSPTRGDVARFGLILAGAFLSKFSSGLFLFVFPAVALSLRLRPLPEQPREKAELRLWRRCARRNFLKSIGWAAVFVYFVYMVLSWNEPTASFSMIPHFPASPLLRRLLMPAWIYLRGLIGFAFSAGTRPTFILGRAYPHGVWFYFPVVFLLKSQLAFLILLCLAAAAAITLKHQSSTTEAAVPSGMEFHWRCIWVSLVIFTAACLLSRLDISIRHFSVPIALMILLLAPLPRMIQILARSRRFAKAAFGAVVACVIGAITIAVVAYPYYIPFVNVLSMHRPRYFLLNDSNVDWNQALYDVRQFANQRGLNHILLDEYGFSDPQVYVRQAQVWDCQQPSPSDGGQWAIVSASLIADGSNCGWLFRHVHLQIGGGSMYAFLLPSTIPAAGAPDGPPLPKDFRYFGGNGFRGTDIRQIFLRCNRDPNQLQPTMNEFMAAAQEQSTNGKAK